MVFSVTKFNDAGAYVKIAIFSQRITVTLMPVAVIFFSTR